MSKCGFMLGAMFLIATTMGLSDASAQATPPPDDGKEAVKAPPPPATKKANPFDDNAKSGPPCSVPGPCGKCDCPDAAHMSTKPADPLRK